MLVSFDVLKRIEAPTMIGNTILPALPRKFDSLLVKTSSTQSRETTAADSFRFDKSFGEQVD